MKFTIALIALLAMLNGALAVDTAAELDNRHVVALKALMNSMPKNAGVLKGGEQICVEDPSNGALKCCVQIPVLGNQGLCATVDYVEGKNDIVVDVRLAGLPIFRKEFNNITTGFCFDILKGNICVNVTSPSFTPTGVCGCLDANIDLFGTKLPLRVGCFAFGKSCAESNCDDYNYDCAPCTVLNACGWCANTGSCVRGDARAPSTGSCPNWAFSKQQCS